MRYSLQPTALYFALFLLNGFRPIDSGLLTNDLLDQVIDKIHVIHPHKCEDCNTDVQLNTIEIIRKNGYPAEAHVVLTEDGYLLTMHRIPGPPGAPAVFLQHGLLCASSVWVVSGKGHALAYMLADHGYDVWMGNIRGNTYSRAHISLKTSDSRFWDFSWHEMGLYDLPAQVTYVTNITNQQKLIFIGHSMGTTISFVTATERPDIASKISVMLQLAPVVFMDHLRSPLRALSHLTKQVKFVTNNLGDAEFSPQTSFKKLLATHGCNDEIESKICSNIVFLVGGYDKEQLNTTLMPVYLSHYPAGSSTKAFLHYAQEMTSGRFEQYDFGPLGNMKIYNSTSPPQYDLSKVKVPVGLFWAENDLLSEPIDVQRLNDKLPNVILNYKVTSPKFTHFDFIWAIDAPTLLYEKLIATMALYN